MREFADRIAALSPAKQALLAQHLQQQESAGTDFQAISRRGDVDPAPLSFAQQRLWFLEQLEPHSPLYNIHAAFRIQGALHRAALQTALDAIVARHEALRTTFTAPDGHPVQEIAAPRPVSLGVVDLAAHPAADREATCQRLLTAEVQRPFDLTRDLLLRALLVRVGEDEHVLLVILHHIASDGWSMGVFWRELGRLYAAAAQGQPFALPALPIQYADYAVWQRQELQGDVLAAHLAYWRRQLADAPPGLELPTDRPRPAGQTFRGAHRTHTLPPPLHAALEALSRAAGATLFMTLLAAFQTLLARYTGQEDLIVGSPIAGRTRVETEGLIGFFVNTLALRADLTGNPPFRTLLTRVRDVCLDAYAHQEVPFEKLVEELKPERTLSQSPLFQVMFALQNAPRTALALPGLTLTPLRVESGTAKFDLTVFVTATDAGLQTLVEYNTDLFAAATIDRLLGHFQTLLEGVVAAPDRPIGDLPLLTDAERHQLLVAWNATATAYPRDACIQTLFEAQVARTPKAVAVVCADQALTYRELNRRANQLAHYLRARGVGPDALVGICLERSLAMVVGLLGILKAGGAYVPLDPTYPPDRLAFMLEDSRAAVLLTQPDLLARLPATAVAPVCLDTAGAALAQASPENPPCAGTADHLAYVIYTSGSTGTPKGVAVPHRAVVRLVVHTDYVTLTPEDIVAQASNAAFDAATFEIWGALLHGASLTIVPQRIVLSPSDLEAFLAQHRVSTLFVTTALFNQCARQAPTTFRHLRTLLFGGETSDPQSVAEVLRHAPPVRLLHVYGPTETTTFATWFEVREVRADVRTIPIGRPIANTEVYVLDRQLQPVPIGVPGELYIGGEGLARGYLNRPDLTAERFLPHPFRQAPEARVYKTGDRVRVLPDGTLEFLGRLDHQVKLRGFRIELGEIEAALGQHPAVHDAIVLVRDEPPGEKRLVAYVVPRTGAMASVEDLRQALRQTLPAYMVPAAFVLLPAFPLTPNGKVDRSALAAFKVERPNERAGFVPPKSTLECQLANVWEEVLNVRPIGIRDDFFDLGGHSLLTVLLLERIEQACGHRPPLSALFTSATIERLAAVLMEDGGERFRSPLVALQPNGSRPPLFFLHGDYHFGAAYARTLARHVGPDQPFYVLHPHGLDGGPVPASIEAMAEDHLATLRAFRPKGPYLLGGYCNGALVAFEMARRLRAFGDRVDLLVVIEASARNARLQWLHRISRWLGTARGLGPADQQQLFLDLRRRALYYADRLSAVKRSGLHEQIAWACRLIGRAGKRLVRPASHVEPSLAQNSDTGKADAENDLGGIDALYRRVVWSYIPHRYPGRVTLLRSTEKLAESPDLDWRRVAGETDVRVLPGDHISCVTQHADAVAEHLRACLEAVCRDHRHEPRDP